MKAVSCVNRSLEVVDLPPPRPEQGQLVLEVLRCGICGSDLHAKDHADELTDVFAEGGYHDFMRSDLVRNIAFGKTGGLIDNHRPGKV